MSAASQIAERLVADPYMIGRYGSVQAFSDAILQAVRSDEDIDQLEAALLAADQLQCPVIHRFGPGIYIRELVMPAGGLMIGAAHRGEHMNIMLKGRVRVRDGLGGVLEMVAPMIFVAPATRKVGYVVEEAVWQNVYATDEQDIEKIEAAFTMPNPRLQAAQARRASLQVMADRADFARVLVEHGYTHEAARAEAEVTADMRLLPHGGYKFRLAQSPIEGRGLFATAPIAAGELIAPARIGAQRTVAGRYTNHSCAPNARMELQDNGDLHLVALKPISGSAGGLLGDEITTDYRGALRIRRQLCQVQ